MSDVNEKILEHFQNPKNIGEIENPDGYCKAENPVNGYVTEIYLKIENDIIKNIKVKSMGCVVTIASASAISEVVKGRNLNDLIAGNENNLARLFDLIKKELGEVPEKNWHCPPTAIQILFLAILDYYEKKEDGKKEKVKKILSELDKYFKERLQEFL